MKSRPTFNPVNPFLGVDIEWDEPPQDSRVLVAIDSSQTIVTENTSPDIPFRYSLNPYRGCTHACSYCYARRTHEYLGFGSGSDFETRILIKPDAPELLRAHFMKSSWKGERLNISGITDPYQPLEGKYKIVRECLEVCADFNQPVSIFTRSPLISRDIPILQELAEVKAIRVFVSIPILDPDLCRALEPGAVRPYHRFKTIARLSEAGIPVGISIAPMIPGLTDSDIPNLLKQGREAGARYSMLQLLRLPGTVSEFFEATLRDKLPLRAERVLNGLREMRNGKFNSTTFGKRSIGQGVRWEMAQQMYRLWHRKLGFEPVPELDNPTPFRRPGSDEQLSLF